MQARDGHIGTANSHMSSEGQDLLVGTSLEFLKLLPVIPEEEDSEDEDEIILDSDSEPGKDLPNQEFLKPIRKRKTHPKMMEQSIAK